jgi:hypothetical protein
MGWLAVDEPWPPTVEQLRESAALPEGAISVRVGGIALAAEAAPSAVEG